MTTKLHTRTATKQCTMRNDIEIPYSKIAVIRYIALFRFEFTWIPGHKTERKSFIFFCLGSLALIALSSFFLFLMIHSHCYVICRSICGSLCTEIEETIFKMPTNEFSTAQAFKKCVLRSQYIEQNCRVLLF